MGVKFSFSSFETAESNIAYFHLLCICKHLGLEMFASALNNIYNL